jgi:anti-sigma factor RsiW
MDHQQIEDELIISLYLMGKLPTTDRVRLEEHLLECSTCQEELELTQGLRGGLKHLARREEERVLRVSSRGPFGWLAQLRALQQSALVVAVVLLLVAAPTVVLTMRSAQIRRELDNQATVSAEWKSRYNAEQQAREKLEKQLAQVSSLQSAAPLYFLPLTRGGNPSHADDVTRVNVPSAAAQQLVLSPELAPRPEFQSYRGRLTDEDGKVIWSAERILPSPVGGLAICLQFSVLHRGNYLLQLEGLERSGRYVPAATYRFRVSVQKQEKPSLP